ncbi:MAG: stage V sporulation protein AE [Clostridia bacterium]|nr:stage V sporulation protein AE [Clostridia bacterium]
MDYIKLINSFWVGGIFCAIAQILIDKTKLTPARIMVTYVVCGIILTAIGVYEHIVNFAGCGATVPIIGFGYTLAKGAEKAVRESGLLGALCGGVSAAACGISAAIFFGFVCSVLFKPKGKKF